MRDSTDGSGIAPEPLEKHEFPIVFTGTAQEYFGIWIVNLLLTIVTIGLWSPWAKVRRERWTAGHTLIDGSPFEYHARGLQIFIGRAVLLLITLAYVLVIVFFPDYIWIPVVGMLVLTPLLLNRGLRFAMRVSGWRGVRFDFNGSYLKTAYYFMLMPLLSYVTLGLFAPVGTRLSARYLAANLSFGGQPFATDPPLKRLYGVLGRTYLLALALLVPVVASVGLTIWYFIANPPPDPSRVEPPFWIFALNAAPYFLFIFGIFVYYSISTTNVVLNHMTLDGRHRFRSTLSPLRFFWILVSGWVVTAVTIGLMHPWAACRRWRYVARHRSVVAVGPLDGFDPTPPQAGKGFFAEYGLFDGIGIGV